MLEFLREPEVRRQSGYTRTALYEAIKHGLFVRPVKFPRTRAVGWSSAEVGVLVTLLSVGTSESELRRVVTQLHAEREQTSRRALAAFDAARAGSQVASA